MACDRKRIKAFLGRLTWPGAFFLAWDLLFPPKRGELAVLVSVANAAAKRESSPDALVADTLHPDVLDGRDIPDEA